MIWWAESHPGGREMKSPFRSRWRAPAIRTDPSPSRMKRPTGSLRLIADGRPAPRDPPSGQPQRPPRQLAMVEPRGAVEQSPPPGQFDREAPGIVAAARRPEGLRPRLPPGKGPPRDRLDDEQAGAAPGRPEESLQKRPPRRVVQLVDGVGGPDPAAPPPQRRLRKVAPQGPAPPSPGPVGPE